jgi:hypothetical protein
LTTFAVMARLPIDDATPQECLDRAFGVDRLRRLARALVRPFR